MRTKLIAFLILSALVTYRPGYAQAARAVDSPTLVASVRAKPVPGRTASEAVSTKTAVSVKKETATTKKSQNSIGRAWSRIMGICQEVHQASQRKK